MKRKLLAVLLLSMTMVIGGTSTVFADGYNPGTDPFANPQGTSIDPLKPGDSKNNPKKDDENANKELAKTFGKTWTKDRGFLPSGGGMSWDIKHGFTQYEVSEDDKWDAHWRVTCPFDDPMVSDGVEKVFFG